MSSMPKGYSADTGLMDFSLALQEMREGKHVRRKSKPEEVYSMKDGKIFWSCNQYYAPLAMLDTDTVTAEDWEQAI